MKQFAGFSSWVLRSLVVGRNSQQPPTTNDQRPTTLSPIAYIAYNEFVGSWTGRSLLFRQGTGEESPNSAEQCAG